MKTNKLNTGLAKARIFTNGKGDADRVRNLEEYRKNYDDLFEKDRRKRERRETEDRDAGPEASD